jgi:hypothetical protein
MAYLELPKRMRSPRMRVGDAFRVVARMDSIPGRKAFLASSADCASFLGSGRWLLTFVNGYMTTTDFQHFAVVQNGRQDCAAPR